MATATTLIDALAKQMGIALALENGVCALFDQQSEVVIIEIPTAGDVAILHCRAGIAPRPRAA
jgi:hypothetical protein